jgi:integrase
MKEKKIWFPEILPIDLDLRKKWFVEYYKPNPGTEKGVRVRVYEGINRLKTVESRLQFANQIVRRIKREKANSIVIEKPKIIPVLPKSILLETLKSSNNYINTKTISTYQNMALRWINFLKPKPDYEATREDALNFIHTLFEDGLSNKTVKHYQANIKGLYSKYAVLKDDESIKNPFRKMPLIKVSSQSLRYFSDAQISRIKEYCIIHHPNLWIACLLQYYCFIRPNELRQLQAGNFNLAANYIEIPGKISKNRKTQKVSIPRPLSRELEFIDQMEHNEFVFKNIKNKVVSRDYLSKLHKTVLNELKMGGHYGFYSWKHTGVVKAVKAGIHIKDLQLQLRHHSLDMVNEYLKNLGVLDCDRIRDLFPEI